MAVFQVNIGQPVATHSFLLGLSRQDYHIGTTPVLTIVLLIQ